MAQRRRDLEIAIKARDQYSAALRKAEGDISKFEAARRRTQQRRDALSNASKNIEETSAAYRRASEDAQRYARAMADATTADRLSAAEQRELRDAFGLARDRSRDLKKALADQRAELNRLRGASQGTFKNFVRSAEAQQKEALASRQAKEADESRSRVLGDLQKRLEAARQSGRRYQDAARNAMQSSDPRRQALGRVTGARTGLDQAQKEAQAYARALNEARRAGNLTEAEMEQLSTAFDQSRNAVRQAKQELLDARQALQGTAVASDRMGDETVQTTTSLRRLSAATEEATADQRRLEQQSRRTGTAFGSLRRGTGSSDLAEQTAGAWGTRQGRGPLGLRPYELTNLSYQINDVVSGLAMGQPVMQVFAQQAGQIIQIFPKMVTAIFKLAPAIAVLAPFALALRRISVEANRLSEIQTSLDMMADGAQYSATRLAGLSEELDRAGASFKDAQATITALAGEDLSFDAIEALSTAALQLSQIRGSSLEDATQTITDAFSGGVEGVRELDAEIGFLTADQYELILSLQEAGDEAEALTVAAEALRQKTTEVAGETDGWAAAVNSLGGAWTAAMDRLSDSATIRLAARALRELGEAVEFAAGGLERWLEQDAPDIPEFEIDVSLSDQALEEEIKKAEGRIEAARTRQGLFGLASNPIVSSGFSQFFGQQNDAARESIALEELRIELLEEERRRREQIAQDQENQEKLQLDTNQLVEKHLDDLREEARLAELSKRERYIEEQVQQARNEAMERANELGVEFLGLTERQVANIREMAGELFDMKFPEVPNYEAQFTASRFAGEGGDQEELVRAVTLVARDLGVAAKDILAVMSFETGGTLDPWKAGPTTQHGQHRGLIQWGEPQRERYGVSEDTSVTDQVMAAGSYMKDHGVRPGMGLAQIYASVLAGDANRVNASDVHNGGAVSNLTESVEGADFSGHIARAEALLATYNDVAEATGRLSDEQERAEERATEFHERQNAALEQTQFELSLEDENLVARQTALALREAELAAQEAGTELTAEQREQIEATTRAKYQEQMLDEQRNQRLQEAKQLSAEIRQIQERQKFLEEERDYAASVGDEAGVAAAEEELLRVNEQLDQAIEKAIAFWQELGGPEAERAIEAIKRTRAELGRTEVQTVTTAEEMNKMIAGSMVNAFDRFSERVADGENALTAFREEFMRMAAEVLIQIGRMILQQAIFNALSGMFGGGGGLGGRIAGGVNSMFFHDGGVVGRGGTGRMVPATAFAGAARYHNGGMAGLKPNEVPAVLEEGEEVLTEDDPRHRENIGGPGGSSRRPMTIVNAFDAPGFLESALADTAGQEAFVNFVRANKDSVKAAME